MLVTYFFVPDKTGIDLAVEDALWLEYLAENGWEGEVGEDDEEGILTEKVRVGKEDESVDEKV